MTQRSIETAVQMQASEHKQKQTPRAVLERTKF